MWSNGIKRVLVFLSLLSILILIQLLSTSGTFDYFETKLSSTGDLNPQSGKVEIKTEVETETEAEAEAEEKAEWTDPCHFRNGTHPLPVILMALGRSGSSVTWDALSALTGERNIAYEVTGGNANKSKVFFNEMQENPLAFHNWTIQRLCHIQQRRPDISPHAGIAGFQWKPYMTSFDHEYAIEGLRTIAIAQTRDCDPQVKLVYLTRNALDRKISNIRHLNSKQTKKKITAHCKVGDEECIREHSKFDEHIILPTGKELISWLRQSAAHHERIVKRLEELDVPYVQVSYNKLYNADNTEEWKRIFRFLGVGPTASLTMKEVKAAFSMASTHRKSRNETIVNFEDVRDTLVEAGLEYLLSD